MTHTLNVVTRVGADHKVTIELPLAVPEGDVELFVVAVSQEAPKRKTLGDILESGIVGMWSDRNDLPNTEEEFAGYREHLWERPRE